MSMMGTIQVARLELLFFMSLCALGAVDGLPVSEPTNNIEEFTGLGLVKAKSVQHSLSMHRVPNSVNYLRKFNQHSSAMLQAVPPTNCWTDPGLWLAFGLTLIPLLLVFAWVVFLVVRYRREEKNLSPDLHAWWVESQKPNITDVSQGVAPKSDEEIITPPLSLVLFGCLVLCNINISLTIIMPSSHEAMDKAGGQPNDEAIAMSGLVIGAYGIGAFASLYGFYYLTKVSIFACFVLQCFFVLLGNGLYIYGVWAFESGSVGWLLVLARFICGAHGGVYYTVFASMTAFTVREARVKYFGYLNAAAGLGLALGPVLSSLSIAFPLVALPRPALAAGMSFGLTLILLILIVLFFPWTMANLCEGTSTDPEDVFSNEKTLPTVPEKFCTVWIAAAWIAVTLGLSVALLRLFFRVGWEAAAALILLEDYSFGVVVVGYVVGAVVMTMVAAQLLVGCYLSGKCSLRMLSQCIGIIEIAACCLMFRWGEPGMLSLVCFLVGSFALYIANQLTSTVFNAMMMTYVMPGHSVLDVESMNLMLNAMCFLGTFLGPLMTRFMLSICFHQNTFAGFILLLTLFQASCVEVGLGGLSAHSVVEADKFDSEPPESKSPEPPPMMVLTRSTSPHVDLSAPPSPVVLTRAISQ